MKHTTAKIGKRVNIILVGGARFVDKLVAIKSQFYEFERRGRIAKDRIRSLSIFRMHGNAT